jgi:hypothetical protein
MVNSNPMPLASLAHICFCFFHPTLSTSTFSTHFTFIRTLANASLVVNRITIVMPLVLPRRRWMPRLHTRPHGPAPTARSAHAHRDTLGLRLLRRIMTTSSSSSALVRELVIARPVSALATTDSGVKDAAALPALTSALDTALARV